MDTDGDDLVRAHQLQHGEIHSLVEATAQPLFANPIVALVLCKFSGEKPLQGVERDGGERPIVCPTRLALRHPDEECLTYYFMLDASLSNVREVLTHMSAPVVTIDGGELTFRDLI